MEEGMEEGIEKGEQEGAEGGQDDSFRRFGLSETLLRTIDEVGYETPTPIQLHTIPALLAGRDVIGQAQTGTGKTAAFALPILDRLDKRRAAVQALVLTPTRELGIQVAEAFHTYSKRLGAVRILPVYGGQSISLQIQRLRAGVHVVVGTPGRIMDHLRRGTLDFAALKMVVLDEADEMLRMGFIEDVEWILSQAPEELQKALFSATIPPEIRRIADRYLHDPVTAEFRHETLTVPTIEQRYMIVPESGKVAALTDVLETEVDPGEAVLIFARTKTGSDDLAEKLQARGYAAEAMHGDMSQAQREGVVRRLRSGQLDTVVATDVAARGWDVERIGLVVNYDIPHDVESYVHRIGRTGRAGRAGKAILFVTPRERRLLRDIERFTGQRITAGKTPTRADVAARRIALFKERILGNLDSEDLELYINLVEELATESGRDMAEIAAAAARLAQGDKPLHVVVEPDPVEFAHVDGGMVRLFISAGRAAGMRPADVVGAISNEADMPGREIGAIDIYDRFTLVDIPEAYARRVLERMSSTLIRNQEVEVRVATEKPPQRPGGRRAGPSGGAAPFGRRKPGYKGRFGAGRPQSRGKRREG